ncbi:hypothetical protein QYF36_004716 [Acer negundo]|nr:hypothetical protein QYF36_004716 [Acer negundo]
MGNMGKGQVWINGQRIGRYWPAYTVTSSYGYCSYIGTYNEKKCLSNRGDDSQRWYHVPRSWLNLAGNLLVVFEEWGGDPNGIQLVRREVDSVCAYMHEWQPTLVNWQMQASEWVCGSYRQGSCHAFHSYDAFQRLCVGQNMCTVTVAPETFGGDPCPNVMKQLVVETVCG